MSKNAKKQSGGRPRRFLKELDFDIGLVKRWEAIAGYRKEDLNHDERKLQQMIDQTYDRRKDIVDSTASDINFRLHYDFGNEEEDKPTTVTFTQYQDHHTIIPVTIDIKIEKHDGNSQLWHYDGKWNLIRG